MRRRSAIWRDVHINYTEAPVSLLAGYGDGVGIADQTDVREVVGLRQREIAFGVVRWDRTPEPITLCALFSGPSHLTPKVRALLDFLDEHLGTDRDPRLNQALAKGYFTDRLLAPTSGP